LPACLLACLPACLRLLACLPACLLACWVLAGRALRPRPLIFSIGVRVSNQYFFVVGSSFYQQSNVLSSSILTFVNSQAF
jgi:hypothetical protein